MASQPGVVTVNYADGGTTTDHKNAVVTYVTQLIEQVISARVADGGDSVRRDSAIQMLKGQFQPNIAEISAALDKFATAVNTGMDGFQQIDKPIG